ncbi:hypothetical protein N5C81_13295 [Rhizobium pusense]|uniref:hypothetical protein n=1 Tax=Agrobacterium pusense TaxID=648995 RepID=UPI00244D1287|nr:hypothetical protein [Agrobacterium pusense]MDH1268596.1 hypothetical protein [Agrobacterium pusense]
MQSKIAELLHQYFELGVAEGREGRNHDTEAGDAQRVLSEIEAEIAALSAAEPACCGKPVHEGSPEAYTLECCGKFVQPAPSVAVKALEWNDDPCPAAKCAFGHYVINENYSLVELFVGYGRASITGLGRIQLDHGATADDLKAAAQADYEARIRSALSAQVQDVAEERTEVCERCQGNGEIVTDWERYRHPHEGDVGDEAVAECPDCDGIGKVSAQDGWKIVPTAPTEDMLCAVDHDDCATPDAAERAYRAMLSAAPAKQEGGE